MDSITSCVIKYTQPNYVSRKVKFFGYQYFTKNYNKIQSRSFKGLNTRYFEKL